MVEKKLLTKKEKDISNWYLELIELAELADYSPVKGCMIIRPYGYAIWENIQKIFDSFIKQDGVENAYFPVFIPYSFLQREKKHVKGFKPELAIVTIGGGEELGEPLVVRPTSETIMYPTFSKWLKSYKQLPLKVNQWCNVVRWEKRTYPFLRTTEFLWQEGHTAHLTEKEAEDMAIKALNWYKKLYEEYFAIKPIIGIKSESEKFAGGKRTYTVEIVLPNGKALQGATSHNLGQNFAKAFDVKVLNEKNKLVYVYQTSWGLSTRSIGALILVHGDNHGLVLPPKLAPIQVVILPVFSKKPSKKLIDLVKRLENELKASNIRITTDWDIEKTLGWKRNYWEIKGVPLRIEVGEKELAEDSITLVKRNTFEKLKVKQNSCVREITKLLEQIQKELLQESKKYLKQLVVEVNNKEEFIKALESKKLIKGFWCENEKCEKKMKDETKATTRALELEEIDKQAKGNCVYCGRPASRRWIIGRAY